MTNFADISQQALSGKHNMASSAFQALRDARARGAEPSEKVNFDDLVDTLNPLQHIPVVSTLYRELTGDNISAQARMAGGAIYGGPIGLATSMIDSTINAMTGDDIGGHIYATLFGESRTEENSSNARMASADTANAPIPLPPNVAMTGSISKPASSAETKTESSATRPPTPLPQLSPEAFNALLGSFSDPEAAKTANAGLAKQINDEEKTVATSETRTSNLTSQITSAGTPRPTTLFDSMSAGLEQLEALKSANARNLSLGANGQSTMAGF